MQNTRKVLARVLLGCAMLLMAASVYVGFSKCGAPLQANLALGNTIPFNCHGTTVFITSLQQSLDNWLLPLSLLFLLAEELVRYSHRLPFKRK